MVAPRIDIELMGSFGDQKKRVRIKSADPAKHGYEIYIDSYYHGWIDRRNGVEEAHFAHKSDLTADELLLAFELIDAYLYE